MKQQYALVTGTSSGLGFEMAQFLLEENYIVFGCSRNGTNIDHDNFIDIEVDLRDEDSVIEVFDDIGRETYGLHLIVNNAGVYEMSALVDTDSDVFENHLKTNVMAPFYVLKYAHDYLIENISHIIHISSIAAKKGFPNVSAYCASKFALNGLIESVREEWKPMGVRFSTLMPGAIDTSIWDNISDDFERSKMLDPEDFLQVFEMIVKSPDNMQFPEVSFLHKSGMLE